MSGKICCTVETLRRWVQEAEVNYGVRRGVTADTAARVKALEREVRKLRQANVRSITQRRGKRWKPSASRG